MSKRKFIQRFVTYFDWGNKVTTKMAVTKGRITQYLPTVTGHKIHTLVLQTPLLESCKVRSRHSASWAEILLGSFIEESDGEQVEQKGLGLLDFNSLLLL
jgi:hypothetical protein